MNIEEGTPLITTFKSNNISVYRKKINTQTKKIGSSQITINLMVNA